MDPLNGIAITKHGVVDMWGLAVALQPSFEAVPHNLPKSGLDRFLCQFWSLKLHFCGSFWLAGLSIDKP